ncbi:MAG TPA: RecQ family ATP-dependent DNA helicase [Cytophagales bacterium]|nr:RecQ family ATP-dependent DNA helicase [Cytophagales bacterium]
MKTPHQVLQEVWGYPDFRPLQLDIVEATLAGKDTLALLPTGGGKSICFQVPGLVREGITLVVSPLIALMKDQVEQLKRRGVSAAAVYSGMSKREIDITLDNAIYGNLKFLYLSPERLQTELLRERVKRMKVALLAIDEAHCISQWGYDFRPPYLKIPEFRELIPEVNVIAVTASATPQVQADIQEKLAFKKGSGFFQKSFARPNLSYSVRKVDNKGPKLLEILQKIPGTSVVYVRSRRRTEEIARWLQGKGISADFYHAGMTGEERTQKQADWIEDRTRVIVATNAFGMGIDKPDVRTVVHLDLPDHLEAYYQEAGRGGRDEKKAFAVMLYNDADVQNLRRRITAAYPSPEFMRKVYQALANLYQIAVGSHVLSSFTLDVEAFAKQYNLPPGATYHALKRLEDSDILQLSESFHQPSKVHFRVDNRRLYQFEIAEAGFEPLLKALLRQYGGELFANFLPISESRIASEIKRSVSEVTRQLNALAQRDILDYDPRKEKPQLTFLTTRYDASHLPLDVKWLEERKQRDVEKMEAMIHYTEHRNRCRTQLILEYFGEVSYDRCGVCDWCVEQKRAAQKPDTADRDQILALLAQYPQTPAELATNLSIPREALKQSLQLLLDQGHVQYTPEGKVEVA